ncbi:cupin domain-containing protein [Maribacter sp. Asnod1-A12]|uniref:cupin domain-containing protein n=1 Tax=Maribacter sp. Asnod1-A12 TaxID=3160576 RepID=UPI00386AE219
MKDIIKIIGEHSVYDDAQLTECPSWPEETKIEGNLRHWEKEIFRGKELIGSIWKSESGILKDVDYPFDQVVFVMEGTLILKPDNGKEQHYKEGDIFLYPKGFTGLWKMPTAYKELIIVERNTWDNQE